MKPICFLKKPCRGFKQLFRVNPRLLQPICILITCQHGLRVKSGLETIIVQHHHAHIASCMAENGIDEPVIGLAFDGTGYGTDGHTWGSEFMVCDYEGFKRHAHFAYMPMPGGDRASEEPWRMGLSLLYQAFGEAMVDLDLPLLRMTDRRKTERQLSRL